MGILKFYCDLELEHRNAISSQDSLANDNVLPNQVWYQKDQQLRRYIRNCHILIIGALAVTLTLKIANQYFCMTLWLMMMHPDTKFAYKKKKKKSFAVYKISSEQTFIEPLLCP